MKLKKTISCAAMLIVIGTAIACNKLPVSDLPEQTPEVTQGGQVTENITLTPVLTKSPGLTSSPEVVATVTPFVDDRQELIPIDEEHFEGDFLRVLLKKNFDLDNDGYLSKLERERVDLIGIDNDFFRSTQMVEELNYILEPLSSVSYEKVFQYFPNLKEFVCPVASDIVVRNHASIGDISHGGEWGERKSIVVEACPELRSVYVGDVCEYVSITEVPQGVVVIDTENLQPEYVLDGNIFLRAFPYLDERELTSFLDEADLTWKNVKEQSAGYKEEEINPALQGVLFEEFSYEVLEKVEDVYDENGIRGWNICVDTKEKVYGKYPFSLYCEERPSEEDFKTKVSKVPQFSPLAYSPNRGVFGEAVLELETVYKSETGEQVIGTLEKNRFCLVAPDGSVQLYRTEEEWSIPDYDEKAYQVENPGYLSVMEMKEYLEENEVFLKTDSLDIYE